MVLDFSINETNEAASMHYSFPIKKADAKETLLFANEMVAFFVSQKDKKSELNSQDKNSLEKILPAGCKLVSYMAGYLNQDQSDPEALPEIKAGLKVLLKLFSGMVKKAATPLKL